jgi:tRNA(Ile)-lysidine synthase
VFVKQALLEERVGDLLSRLGVAATPMVVAISGGADSVALALALAALQTQARTGALVLAHLNHRLRGSESDADEAFVLELAAELSAGGAHVLCRTQQLDVKGLARERGANLEKTARELRYDWLTQVARADCAAWLATGHTADDQAETVLHRLLRGTGLHGLSGIPLRRGLAQGIEIVRPLLTSTRADVLDYLQARKQNFRQDSSNADLGFTRNRIRHELLPELAKNYNPAIVSVVCRLAKQAREVQAGIEVEAAKLLADVELPRAGCLLVLKADRLAAAPRNLVREAFRLLWQRENWPTGSMTFEHWDHLAALAHVDEATCDFPEGVRARRHASVIQLGRR